MQRRPNLIFKSNNLEDYNQPFSLSELTDCIMKSHNTAVSPDEIHYEFLKKLPSCSLDFLLQAFNEVWVSGKFPTSWKQATYFPFLSLERIILIHLITVQLLLLVACVKHWNV